VKFFSVLYRLRVTTNRCTFLLDGWFILGHHRNTVISRCGTVMCCIASYTCQLQSHTVAISIDRIVCTVYCSFYCRISPLYRYHGDRHQLLSELSTVLSSVLYCQCRFNHVLPFSNMCGINRPLKRLRQSDGNTDKTPLRQAPMQQNSVQCKLPSFYWECHQRKHRSTLFTVYFYATPHKMSRNCNLMNTLKLSTSSGTHTANSSFSVGLWRTK